MSSFLNQIAINLNPRRSIKTRLGGLLGATIFSLSIFACLIIGKISSIQLEADVGYSFAELAYQITDKLDRGIYERYLDIQILANLEPIRNPNIPISQKRELLQKLQSSYYGDYAWVGITDQQGKVLASTGKLLEGETVASRPWFQQAKNAPYIGDVNEAKLLAKLLPNPTKEPLRFVDVSMPITDNQGKFQGVVGAHLSLNWVQEVQNSVLHSLWQRRQIEMFILNYKGEILLAPSKFPLTKGVATQPSVKAALQGQHSYLIETWSDGKAYITGFKRSQGYRDFQGLGWLVLVRQPVSVAFAPIKILQHNLILCSVVSGLLLAVAAWLITGCIISPIVAIASAADQIRRGDTTAEIPTFKGHDEIARLAKTLKQLIHTLTQQEHTLQDSQEQLNLALQAAQIGIWNLNLQTGILTWSEIHERLFGMIPGSFDGSYQTFIKCVHPEDRELLEKNVTICQINQTPYAHEFRIIWSDGSIHWLAAYGQFFYDETGEAVRMTGTVMEISGRKIAQIALAQREQQYRTLVENFPNGTILLFDHDLRYTLVDGKGLAEAGISKELTEGKTMMEFLPSELVKIREPIYREALAGNASTCEVPYGNFIYLVDTLPIKNEQGEILGGMVMSQNITERKRAELALLQLTDQLELKIQERTAELIEANKQLQQEILVRQFAEKQLHESQICLKLINSISTQITIGSSPFAAIEGTVTKLSKHFKHWRVAYSTINNRGIATVIRAIEPPGMPALKGLVTDLTVAPEYLQTLRNQQPVFITDIASDHKVSPLADAWAEGATQAILEVPLHYPEGLVGLLSFHSKTPHQWSAYEIATLIEVADYLSITIREAQEKQKRAKAESAMRESEERYRQLVEHSPETILVYNDEKIVYINPAGSQLFGASNPNVLLNTSLLERVHPDYQSLVQERIDRLMQHKQVLPLAERQMVRCDGKIIDVETTLAPIIHQGKPAVQFLIRDISQRKQAEQELQQSEMLMRSLHQVATMPKLSIQERFQEVMVIGCRHFNFEFGFLSSVEGNNYKILAVQTPDNSVAVGDVFDLRKTYCQETLKRENALYFHHAKAGAWSNHSGYINFQMEAYIGIRIIVNDCPYGTLCFTSRTSATKDFSALDIELIKLLAQWVSSELERSKAAATLEQLRHQNELILNSAGEGICGINREGNISFVNPAAAKMLGYQVKELINQPICSQCFSFKADKTPLTLKESFLYPVLKNGIVQHFKEEKFWRKNGSSFPVECLATPMRERKVPQKAARDILDTFLPVTSFIPNLNSEIVGVVITFSDITERQTIERMKDEFISVVSHELRTPLTAIRGSLGLIASGLLTTKPEKVNRMLEIAAANTDRLTRLINDILDIERIESGKIPMEQTIYDVSEAISHSVESLRIMAQRDHITLATSPVNARVWADRDRLIQVLTNLISNAIKFSPCNTTIEISAEPLNAASLPLYQKQLNNNQSLLLFKIKDQGRGIPTDQLETIFRRFGQVNASDSRDQGGTGLGLAICRSIIQQHQGNIWVESQLGEGSTFYFTLPLFNDTNPTNVIKNLSISSSQLAEE